MKSTLLLKNHDRTKANQQLANSLEQVKKLSRLLPICGHCKKVRDDKGSWNQMEAYIEKHSKAKFSHGVCRDCAAKYYPDLNIYDDTADHKISDIDT